MSIGTAIVLLLAVAAIAALARQLRRWRRAEARPPAWRIGAILLLQLACALLLGLTLLPPERASGARTLAVATDGADASAIRAARDAGALLVTLPEADPGTAGAAGAMRMPDLATALRLHPGVSRLRVIGGGLEARDLDAARGLPVYFEPVPLPRGFVELHSPARAVVGGTLRVAGRVHDAAGARIELLDPAGDVHDRATPDEDGRFIVEAPVRVAGPSSYRLRLLEGGAGDGEEGDSDDAGAGAGAGAGAIVIEEADVPVHALAGAKTRILLLAGAPGPEVKYLRRWAADAGLELHSRMELGAGIALGDPPVAFDAPTLAGFDLAIVDERSWSSLGAARREALLAAVGQGMGLMFRITVPPDASTREALRRLGFTVGEAGAGIGDSVVLDAPGPEREAGGDAPGTTRLPELARQPRRFEASDAVPLLRDAGGEPLGAWRSEGRGRVAAWNLDLSFRLVLAGHGDRHARLWSEAVGTLARARGAEAPRWSGLAREGRRAVLCGLAPGAALAGEDGALLHPLPDPAAGGCAAVWPVQAGWQRAIAGGQDPRGADAGLLYVHAAGALPGVDARERRDATLRLAADALAPDVHAAGSIAPRVPGPRWPWFLLWLAAAGLLWWLERPSR